MAAGDATPGAIALAAFGEPAEVGAWPLVEDGAADAVGAAVAVGDEVAKGEFPPELCGAESVGAGSATGLPVGWDGDDEGAACGALVGTAPEEGADCGAVAGELVGVLAGAGGVGAALGGSGATGAIEGALTTNVFDW